MLYKRGQAPKIPRLLPET